MSQELSILGVLELIDDLAAEGDQADRQGCPEPALMLAAVSS
jgi:hypothetical protein